MRKKKGSGGGAKENRGATLFDDEGNTRADLLADAELAGNGREEEKEDGGGGGRGKEVIGRDVSPCTGGDKAFQDDSVRRVPAKAHLHTICSAYKWKPPAFECCKEEGMSHSKLFTFKVVVEIEEAQGTGTVLECFGAPRPQKKRAAQDAAEGAFWYLKQRGYFPIVNTKRARHDNSEEVAKHWKSRQAETSQARQTQTGSNSGNGCNMPETKTSLALFPTLDGSKPANS